MVQHPADLGEEHPDVLAPGRNLQPHQFFHRQRERVFLVLGRDVIQTVEIRYRLEVVLVLDELFRAPVQQADVRVRSFHHLAIHFQDQAQHPVGRGMLRAEIEIEIPDLYFGHQEPPFPSAAFSPAESPSNAFSSPGSSLWTPSQGLRKSKLRNSCVSFTGS